MANNKNNISCSSEIRPSILFFSTNGPMHDDDTAEKLAAAMRKRLGVPVMGNDAATKRATHTGTDNRAPAIDSLSNPLERPAAISGIGSKIAEHRERTLDRAIGELRAKLR